MKHNFIYLSPNPTAKDICYEGDFGEIDLTQVLAQNVASISFNGSVDKISFRNNDFIKPKVFLNGNTNLVIKNNFLIDKLTNYAILYFGDDEIITIPEGIKNISPHCFNVADSKKTIIKPKSLQTYDYRAILGFVDCNWIQCK